LGKHNKNTVTAADNSKLEEQCKSWEYTHSSLICQ